MFTNGADDHWSDPPGQFNVLRAAHPVYRMLGTDGLAADELPPIGKLVESSLGYYLQHGGHVIDRSYWRIFIEFADKHLKRRR